MGKNKGKGDQRNQGGQQKKEGQEKQKQPEAPKEERTPIITVRICGATESFHLINISVTQEDGKPWKGVWVRVHDGDTYDDSMTNESGSVICRIGKSDKDKTVGFSVLGTPWHRWMPFFGKKEGQQ